MKKWQQGFTLLELVIVLLLLGIMAGLAIPVYVQNMEQSRSQEALINLGAGRESLIRYFVMNQSYAGATMPLNGDPGTCDFNPNAILGGQTQIFQYSLSGLSAAGFTLTATRIAAPGNPVPAGGPNTISINETGTLTKQGAYA